MVPLPRRRGRIYRRQPFFGVTSPALAGAATAGASPTAAGGADCATFGSLSAGLLLSPEALAAAGVTPEQWRVLSVLEAGGGRTMSDLAQTAVVPAATAMKAAASTPAAGMVTTQAARVRTSAARWARATGAPAAVEMTAASDAVVLLGHARPIGEPVFSHGPFVMNTREEIVQAIHDYQAGRFGPPPAV